MCRSRRFGLHEFRGSNERVKKLVLGVANLGSLLGSRLVVSAYGVRNISILSCFGEFFDRVIGNHGNCRRLLPLAVKIGWWRVLGVGVLFSIVC